MRKNNKKTKKEMREEIANKYQDYESLFDQIATDGETLTPKLQEVQFLIDHVNQRIQYTETRITRTVTFSITLVGAGMAFLAFATKLNGTSFIFALFTSGLLILL